MVIVSTGYDAKRWIAQHLASINAQTFKAWHHAYFDDGRRGFEGRGTASENLYRAVHALVPETIVVCVDADDWLATPLALERVAKAYENPNVWMTFGQFRTWPGNLPGWASGYSASVSVKGLFRQDTWRATHLKTFRAGLFQQVPMGWLQRGGEWLTRAVDQATMFPMLEMARERHAFIPEVLYTYNTANPLAAANKGEDKQGGPEWDASSYVRGLHPLARLDKRPW